MKLVQPNPQNIEPPTQIDQNKYLVTSSHKDKAYEVTIIDSGIGACDCQDFYYRGRQCKHIIKVLSYIFGVNN